MFDHGEVASPTLVPGIDGTLAERDRVLHGLRERIHGMQDGLPRVPLAGPEALADLIGLRTGGAYEVDGLTLATTMIAPITAEGGWAAVVGVGDFGAEAAAQRGIELGRTLLVPEPGEHWPEAVAALVDVVTVVLVKVPGRIDPRVASRISARLRKRSTALLVWGHWPGSEARLELVGSRWAGVDRGVGRLRSRRVEVAIRRGSAPPRLAVLEFGESGGPHRLAPEGGARGSLLVADGAG